MAQEPNAIFAINSLDRYAGQPVRNLSRIGGTLVNGSSIIIVSAGSLRVGAVLEGVVQLQDDTVVTYVSPLGTQGFMSKPAIGNLVTADAIIQVLTTTSAIQPVSNSLNSQYSNQAPFANNFTIQSPGALIYGYMYKLIVSQIQVQYAIPTICFERNNTFYIAPAFPADTYYEFVIPQGFYTPNELAAALQVIIRQNAWGLAALMTVSYNLTEGFVFESTSVPPESFFFPSLETLQIGIDPPPTPNVINNILKTYRTLGITLSNAGNPAPIPSRQVSGDLPNFLYTPYIDICSEVLTNYQKVKDTNTSPEKSKGAIARVYLSGVGNPQVTTPDSALGSSPFIITVDLNSPKVIRWTPDVAVPSIDIQVTDQYGDYIFGPEYGFSTEFQMTLLAVEKEE
jgi:hypothetical protein